MGLVHAEIELINHGDLEMVRRGFMDKDEVKRAFVNVLVDSGAYVLAINERIKEMLNLNVEGTRKAILANGEPVYYEVVSAIRIRFANRSCLCEALVLPGDSEPLLGAIPMEDMDLIIHPRRQELVINPEHGIDGLWSLRGIR